MGMFEMMGSQGVVHQIAAYVVRARGKALAEDVRRKVADCVFDLMIASVTGINANGPVATRKTVQQMAAAGRSSVWWTDLVTNSLYAAWANATAAAAADLDDGNRRAKGHPGATVIPVALAVGEQTGASLEEIEAAIDIGYNVGLTVATARRATEFGVSNTWGVFGAVATACALLKLDADKIEHALGLAGGHTPTHTLTERRQPGNTAEGPLRFEGSDLKEAIPWAVYTGLVAVFQAANGHTGPRNVLEFKTIYDFPVDLQLGSKHYVFDTYFKLYASCRYSHPAIDAVLLLKTQESFDAADITSITVDTFVNAANLARVTQPKNDAELIYSIPYAVALPLIDGANSLLPFTKQAFGRPDVTALAEKVSVRLDAVINDAFPAQTLSRVTIELKDGRTFMSPTIGPKGEATDPLTSDELVKKCIAATRLEVGPVQQHQLIEAALSLRNMGTLHPLIACIRNLHLGRIYRNESS